MNMPPHLFLFCPLDKCGNDNGNDHDAIEGKLFIGHKANPMSLSPICRFLSTPPTSPPSMLRGGLGEAGPEYEKRRVCLGFGLIYL